MDIPDAGQGRDAAREKASRIGGTDGGRDSLRDRVGAGVCYFDRVVRSATRNLGHRFDGNDSSSIISPQCNP